MWYCAPAFFAYFAVPVPFSPFVSLLNSRVAFVAKILSFVSFFSSFPLFSPRFTSFDALAFFCALAIYAIRVRRAQLTLINTAPPYTPEPRNTIFKGPSCLSILKTQLFVGSLIFVLLDLPTVTTVFVWKARILSPTSSAPTPCTSPLLE